MDRLNRRLDALALQLHIDLDALIAHDQAHRRGHPVSWEELVALGVDPTTGEPIR